MNEDVTVEVDEDNDKQKTKKQKDLSNTASALLTLGAASVAVEFLSFVDTILALPLLFAGASTLTEDYLNRKDES